MINGLHTVLYSRTPEATRAFFRDVLGRPSVDAGQGWLIFGMPPAELGIHPADGDAPPELYLMCHDLDATLAQLKERGVEPVREITEQGWGRVTAIQIPGAGEMGLYQPRHSTALGLS